MNIRIITDSACDMTCQEALNKNVDVIPLKTRIEGKEYLDGVDISYEEFYLKLESCKELPTTSQPSPYDFAALYEQTRLRGEQAVVITVSSRLSGTYQSASMALEGYENLIWIVDSKNVTIGQRVLVEYAVRLRDEGRNAMEIAEKLEQVKDNICLLGMLETLEYLVKGGRLSKAAGFAGTMLNIKPVLTLEDGVIKVLGKARGSRQSNNFLNETIEKRGGIDFSMPYILAYSGLDDALLRGYVENSRHLWETHARELPFATIGSTIGTHIGPGAIAVAFFTEKK